MLSNAKIRIKENVLDGTIMHSYSFAGKNMCKFKMNDELHNNDLQFEIGRKNFIRSAQIAALLDCPLIRYEIYN